MQPWRLKEDVLNACRLFIAEDLIKRMNPGRLAVVATFVTSQARTRQSGMFRSVFFVATIVLLLCMTFADASRELMDKLLEQYQENTMQRLPQHGDCTNGNIFRRKEW